MIAGTIAVLGAGALGAALFQSTVNGLNSDQDSLAARTKAIEDSRYSLPSSISSSISANCAAFDAMSVIVTSGIDSDAKGAAAINAYITAASANPC